MGKKHLSVLMLYVRSSIIPLLGMLVLIGSIQTGLFLWRMNRGANSLEAVIQSAHLRAVLMSGFLLLAAFLYRINGGGYTLRRLRISERALFLWQSLSYFLCFALLWMAEVIIITLLCQYYLTQPVVNIVSNQTLFLAFYRSDFLHSILPLEEISRWIYLLITFGTLSFTTAGATVRKRYGRNIRNNVPLSLTVASMLFYFVRPLGSLASDVILSLLHTALILYTLWDVWFNAEEVISDENN